MDYQLSRVHRFDIYKVMKISECWFLFEKFETSITTKIENFKNTIPPNTRWFYSDRYCL